MPATADLGKVSDLFAVTFFSLLEALMDEPNAQLDWLWSCTALCGMKARIIAGLGFSAALDAGVRGQKTGGAGGAC